MCVLNTPLIDLIFTLKLLPNAVSEHLIFKTFLGDPPPLAHAHSECASSHTQYIGGGRVGTVEHPQLFGAEHLQLKAVLHNSRHVYF